MKLYRIRRKDTGEYFSAFESMHVNGEAYFGPSGCFWKKPETVWRNLKKLCSVYTERRHEKWGFPWITWENYDPAKLDLYEIVINDVTINGEESINANQFVDAKKLERMFA